MSDNAVESTDEGTEILSGDWRLFKHPRTGAWFVDCVIDGFVYHGGKMHLDGYLAGGWQTVPVTVLKKRSDA